MNASRFAIAWMAACGLLIGSATAGDRPPHADKVGVELDGLGDGARSMPFVDVARTLRPWTIAGKGEPAPTDARGWPTCDASSVMFDVRPAFAWAPPIDDPDAFQPDWSGTYALSFRGRADVNVAEDRRCRVEGLRYDLASKLTTGRVVVPKGVGLLVLNFAKTRRDPKSPEGSGLTDLRLIRPGYPADTKALFTKAFLDSLEPFAVLRYMDWLDTNHPPGYYGDAGHHALEWADRRRADDATQVATGGKYGVAWEHVVALANETGKDLWINVPVAATDAYVEALAKSLKAGLDPKLKVYVEHSNEVWNFGFPQYIYNKLAAIDEVKRGGSNLDADGSKDEEVWTHRRHAKRVVEIGRTFRRVFGAEGRDRVRPIYASWVISPGPYYADMLAWLDTTYGPPKADLYGIAGAAYYNIEGAAPDAGPEALVEAMRASSDRQVSLRAEIGKVAERYGVRHCQYEVGPDVGGGKVENVANRIRSNRLPAMEGLMLHDARENWFDRGGDLYMIFSHCSAYSRFGCWGLSEDVRVRDTPKRRAVDALTKARP